MITLPVVVAVKVRLELAALKVELEATKKPPPIECDWRPAAVNTELVAR